MEDETMEANMNSLPPSHFHQQPPPPQNCPRCFSSNTKFCYYNNYSLTQPRYFCKACRRYWTHGGTLRNVPIGGGTRKSKRPKTSTSDDNSTTESLLGSQNYPGSDASRVYKGLPYNAFIPQMAAVQSLPTGHNQGAALSLHSQLGASVAHFQGMNISSFNQSLIPAARPIGSWIINSGPTNSLTAGRFSFWGGATNISDGPQAGSSLDPYHRWETDYNNKPSY